MNVLSFLVLSRSYDWTANIISKNIDLAAIKLMYYILNDIGSCYGWKRQSRVECFDLVFTTGYFRLTYFDQIFSISFELVMVIIFFIFSRDLLCPSLSGEDTQSETTTE